MADRELQTILNSGEITGIYVGGTNPGDRLQDKDEVDALIAARFAESHTLELSGFSTAASQLPTALDTPLQIEFGAAQDLLNVSIDVAGELTIKTAGTYLITFKMQYGRAGATGTSILLGRIMKNGSQLNGSFAAKLDDANTLIPWSGSFIIPAEANDTFTFEIARDSAGDNSGGLYQIAPTTLAWATAQSALINVHKM